jgi:hypothetical protein
MTLLLSGTDGLSDVDGSAATPAIRGTDANTGIFFPAADTIAFAEGGAEVARFDSSGNLGIGTTSPTARLDVTGSSFATANVNFARRTDDTTVSTAVTWSSSDGNYMARNNGGSLTFNSGNTIGSSVGTERMRIDSSGNVGIGTSSPGYQLHVARAGSTYIRVSSTDVGSGTGLWTTNATNAYLIGAGAASGGSGLEFRDVTNSTTRMILNSSGNLLVGTTSTIPGYTNTDTGVAISPNGISAFSRSGEDFTMTVNNNTGSTYYLISFRAGGSFVGQITSNGTTTTYNTGSDYRLKENIAPMTGALAKVAKLKPVTYTWKSNGSDGQGFIAHELQEVAPDAVSGEKDELDADGNPRYQGIDTSFLVATLTAAIQEQQALIQQLQADVAALKGV